MSNRTAKPKQTSSELILKMKEKGITFQWVNEEKAEEYLTERNNYFRTACYRKNYQKYMNGDNKGKYIDLDFSCLQELSTIDMHLRFLIIRMCLDIEHSLKVRMLKDIEEDPETDGYQIVSRFLEANTYVIKKLEGTAAVSYTKELLYKYFTIEDIYHPEKGKSEKKITAYWDCPVWVLTELLTFGDFIRFYQFYYEGKETSRFSFSLINLVKSLRNGAAHNNCLLSNLTDRSSKAPRELNDAVSRISEINKNQRRKKLSCRVVLEFTALLYLYQKTVTETVKKHRGEELKQLFFVRMQKRKELFQRNELIKSQYDFICRVIRSYYESF